MRANTSLRQLSVKSLLGWVMLFALVFALSSRVPELMRHTQPGEPPVGRGTVAFVLLSCVVLCGRYLFSRQVTPFVLLTLPPALIGFFMWNGFLGVTSSSWSMLLLGCVFSCVISFAAFVEARVSQVFDREEHLQFLLMYRTISGVLFSVGICWVCCKIVQAIYTRPLDIPAIVFGVLLGIWLGPYQVVTRTPSLRTRRINGISVMSVVRAGFVGAVGGAIGYEVFSNYVYGAYLFPARYSPACGIVCAMVAILAQRVMQTPTRDRANGAEAI